MKHLLPVVFLFWALAAHAEPVVMEGIPSTGASITVSSLTVQVDIGTPTPYGGAVPNVALFTTSNVVVGTSGCVLYSTGSLTCPTLSAGAVLSSTLTLTGNGIAQNAFPNTPLLIGGSVNTYFQAVMQNQSNGTAASSAFVLTGDLGGDTSYYLAIGINSSRFSQSGQSAEKSSSTFVVSSDSDLVLWADTNGGLNGGGGSILFGSSSPVSGNIAMAIASNRSVTAYSTVTVQGNAFSVGGASFTVAGGSATVAYSLTAGSFSGPLSGNAATATALAVTPTSCTLPNVALGIAANGNASCSQPSNVTGNAATATALAAAGTVCSAGHVSIGVDASGNCLPGAVDTTATSGSTDTVTSGAMFTALGNVAASTAALAAQFITDPSSYTNTSARGILTSTLTLTDNGIAQNAFPNTPLLIGGSVNTYFQAVMQNQSNGTAASSAFVLTDDLGGDTSYYLAIGINSSKFSQSGQSAEKSSSTFVVSSDSDLVLWADTNGGLNGGGGNILFGSSNPVSGNIAMAIASNRSVTAYSTVTVQGNAFSVGGSSFSVAGGSATVAYSLGVGSLNSSGQITSASTETIKGNAFSVGGSSFTVSGGSTTVAYSLTAGSISTSGPITGSTGTLTGNAFSVGAASFTVSGGSATVAYQLKAGSLSSTGPATASTGTLTGSAFAVGGSTLVVTGGRVGIGTTSPAAPLHVVYSGTAFCATGGVVAIVGGNCVNTFNTSGTFTPTAAIPVVSVLVVAGGGGGATGGGGGGGVIYNSSFNVSTSPITVTIGAGGAAGQYNVSGTNGSNSVFSTLTAVGGGGGAGGGASPTPGSGGSGGGAGAGSGGAGGSGTAGQGSTGGSSTAISPYPSGGGGGAGAVGGAGSGSVSGNGGAGTTSSISGSSLYYAGGGGGNSNSTLVTAGTGGLGGGGNGGTSSSAGVAGTANTGGGGGGGYSGNLGGNGGSGTVIVSYPNQNTTPVALFSGYVGVGTTSPTTLLHMSSGIFTVDGTSAGANFGVNAPVTISSAVFVGTQLSTQAAGGAGAAVTATCPANMFATSGGCNCSGIVGVTAVIGNYNCTTAGCLPTGWVCQDTGSTGAACASFALCTRIQ